MWEDLPLMECYRWRMTFEGLSPTRSLYLQVNKGAKTGWLEERNWRTLMGQTNPPTHVGDLSWLVGINYYPLALTKDIAVCMCVCGGKGLLQHRDRLQYPSVYAETRDGPSHSGT